MRFNRARWGALPSRVCVADPALLLRPDALATPAAFSEVVSLLAIEGTRKTTAPGRHRGSDALLLERIRGQRPVILDVGISDGSTCLDLIEALGGGFEAYYATDRIEEIRACAENGRSFFFDARGACILAANPAFVTFPDAAGGAWRALLRAVHGPIPPFAPEYPAVSVVQPRLRALAGEDRRVVVRSYDVFDPWDGRRPTVVKVANLLNRSYFSDARIRAALRNLWTALEPGGLLLVIDNRDVEKASLAERTGSGFRLVANLADGTEVLGLVLGPLGEGPVDSPS